MSTQPSRYPKRSQAQQAFVLALFPAFATAQPAQSEIEVAMRNYQKTGIVQNEMILAQMAKLASKKEDCSKVLEQIAVENLEPEHKKRLSGGSVVEDLPIISGFFAAKNLIDRFSRGYTDNEFAQFALLVNRGAALRYRSESCNTQPATAAAPPVAASGQQANDLASAAGPAATPNADGSLQSAVSEAPSVNGGTRKVKGIGDWEGEIVGSASPNSVFEPLRIGMKIDDVTKAIGQPHDQLFMATSKSLIPFNFSSDRFRAHYAYKGVGRLVFSSDGGTAFAEMHLVRIVHDGLETGKF